MTSQPGVRLVDVRRSFGTVQAVRGVSFDVREGEFLVLLGPSGSGKTTILRIIAGFDDLSEGEVSIRGRPVADVPPNRRDIGVVFQHFALFPHLSVFRNVGFGLKMRNVPAPELRTRVAEALQMVRLVGFDDRLPSQLSGGQQQRVALARALVTRPAVLLLDEPLGSLDPHLRAEMQAEMRRLQQALSITTIMVTHDQEEAMTMGDRIAILRDGRLQQIGTPREIYEAPASAFVAKFVGAANLFEVSDLRADNGRLLIVTAEGLAMAARYDGRARTRGGLRAVVRPEKVRLGSDRGSVENAYAGRVVSIAYVGATVRCEIAVGDARIAATFPADAPGSRLAAGDAVAVGWPAEAVLLVPEG